MKKNNVLARDYSKFIKQTLIACALLLGVSSVAPLCAEERGDWSMTVGADAANTNLWRGMASGGLCLQPSAYFDYEQGDWAVSLGTWATTSMTKGRYGDHYDEWDLSVEATWKGLTLSLAGYNEYYDREFGGTFLDLGLSYTLSEDVPVTLSWYSIINQTAEGGVDGGRGFDWASAFPSYFEVAYDFSVWEVDFNAAAGFCPFASDYYGSETFSMYNLNLRAGHEFEFEHGGTLPVSAQVMYNPAWDEVFWGVSVGYYFSLDF